MRRFILTLLEAKIIADIFQSIGIGLGSILGGLGALKVLSDWQVKRKNEKLKRKLLRRYPKERLNKDFRLLAHSFSEDSENVIGRSSHVYLCDERTKTRHWIANIITLKLFGFNCDEVTGVSKKILESYAMAEQIDLDPKTY